MRSTLTRSFVRPASHCRLALRTDRPSRSGSRRRHRSRAPAGIAAACGALFACAALAQAAIDVGLRDGLLTLRTDPVPAERLAAALHDATGISFVVTGESTTPLGADFVDEPLHRAIALLAPNHLLVREDARPDAPIIEVVMMMPDPADGGGDSAEFLPSGAPADDVDFNAQPNGPQEVEYDENGLPIDPSALRDPNRVDELQEIQPAQGVAFDDNGMPIDAEDETFDDGFEPEPDIDPVTGEPLQP